MSTLHACGGDMISNWIARGLFDAVGICLWRSTLCSASHRTAPHHTAIAGDIPIPSIART
jgi:hypothetical protein